MSSFTHSLPRRDDPYYGHGRNPPPLTSLGISTMTRKQIRDLRAFAAELSAEGNHAAAREVLALIQSAN